MAQEKDWLDKFADIVGDWIDSLTEKDETQNLGEWSYSTQTKRQREKETTGT